MNTNLPHFTLTEEQFETCMSALMLADNMMADILKLSDISDNDKAEVVTTLLNVRKTYQHMADFLSSMRVIKKAQQSAKKPTK